MKTLLISLLFVFFIIGCENSVQPISTETDSLEKNSEIYSEFPNVNLDEDQQLSKGFFGKLYFKTAFTSPQTDIVIAGKQMVLVNKIVFLALGHDIQINELSLKTNLNFVPTVGKVTISYPTQTGTGTAEGYLFSTGELLFTNLEFFVKKLRLVYLDIYCDVNNIIPGSNMSGLFGSLDLNAHGQFQAEDMKNGRIDTDPTDNLGFARHQEDCNGNLMVVRKTEPVISLLQLPSTQLSNGQKTVSKFSIAAEQHGGVGLRKISWEFQKSSNVNLANFQLFNTSNPTVPFTPAYINVVGNSIEFGFMFEDMIPAGVSKTYELKVIVTSSSGQNEFVKFSLTNSDTGLITNTTQNVEAQSNFVWSDMSQVPHSFQSLDWTNGYLIATPQDWQQLSN